MMGSNRHQNADDGERTNTHCKFDEETKVARLIKTLRHAEEAKGDGIFQSRFFENGRTKRM